MSTPKHTPGPWAVEPRQWDHGASLAIVAPHNGYIVAIVPFDEDIQVVDEPDGDTVRRHPDELPNAAMLAAAPAMYEALQQSLVLVELAELEEWGRAVRGEQQPPTTEAKDRLEKVKAALAQAEGKP